MHIHTQALKKPFAVIFLCVLITFANLTVVQAGNTQITGGTYGSNCNSGGYFTPSSVTISSGDTITFSVPANDPYAGGIQVHGFPQGSFIVPRGGSVTTNAITASVSYYGTWPSTGCLKGSGTVSISTPTPPPSPAPSPSPSPSPAPSPTPSPTPSSTGTSTTSPTGTKSSSTSTTTNQTPSTTSTPQDKANNQSEATSPTKANASSSAATPTSTQTGSAAPVAQMSNTAKLASGGISVVLVGLIGFVTWKFFLKKTKPIPPPAVQPTMPDSNGQTPESTPNEPTNVDEHHPDQ